MNQTEGVQETENESEYKSLRKSFIISDHLKPIRIVIPVIIILMIIVIMSFYAQIQKKNIIANAEQVTNQMAEYIAGSISSVIGYAESSIKLASTTISQSMTSETLEDPVKIIAPMVDNTPFDKIEYIRKDGMNVMNIGDSFDASDRVYFIEGIKGNTGIWNNFHPKNSQETLLNFYTPIVYQGKIAGVLTGYIAAAKQIEPLFEKKLYGQDIYGLLIDENDMVICSTMESEYIEDLSLDLFMERMGATDEQKSRVFNIIDKADDTAVSYKDSDGEERISVARIPEADWKVVIVVPQRSFLAIAGKNTRDSIIVILIISLILISYATFVLIRNIKRRKEITRENIKLEEENRIFNEEKNEYYNTLGTLAVVYNSLHVIDLLHDTYVEFSGKEKFNDIIKNEEGAGQKLLQAINVLTTDECRERALKFVNPETLADRMRNKKYIAAQFISKRIGWFVLAFITMEKDKSGRPVKVILTTQGIDAEIKQKEDLINKSRTDELTGLLNRRAYEEDIYEKNKIPEKDDFVLVSLDVNGLKTVNDNLGHAAGDELLIGAGQCMKKSFAPYGNLYRTGGDEFIAILFCDNEKLKEILAAFEETMSRWRGKLIDSISISYGYVSKTEKPDLSVRELGIISDRRMYEAKAEYYRKAGIDRRGV